MVDAYLIGAGGFGHIHSAVLYYEHVVIPVPVADKYFSVLVQGVDSYLLSRLLDIYVSARLMGIHHPDRVAYTQKQGYEYQNNIVSYFFLHFALIHCTGHTSAHFPQAIHLS